MWRLFQRSLQKLRRVAYRRRIEQVLGRDRLRLESVRNRLEIEWRARELHSWDRAFPAERRAQIFAAQCLADTEEAIVTLFLAMPQVDVLELKVVAPRSDAVLLAGTVHRSALTEERKALSVRMRLNTMGVRYCGVESYLEENGDR